MTEDIEAAGGLMTAVSPSTPSHSIHTGTYNTPSHSRHIQHPSHSINTGTYSTPPILLTQAHTAPLPFY